MKNSKLLLVIPLLIISILPVLPTALPLAHAATGKVCITDSSAPAGCPSSAPTLFASSGSTLTIAVQIAGSDPYNGFNVQISTDSSVLSASSASVSGSTLGGTATVVLECLDGALVAGTACDSTDGPGVVHFAATKLGANVVADGMLFTVTYNVLTATPGIPVDLMSVQISNGTSTANSETSQGATFSNLTDFAIDSSPASIQTPASPASGTSTITLTSFGGFTDFLTLTVTPSAGLTASTADSGLFLAPDSTASTTLTVSASASGTYSVDVTATGTSVTHTVHVVVNVAPPDFTISASPTSLSLAPGDSGSSTISIGSVSGFSGTVALSSAVSPASGLSCSVSPSSVAAPGTSTLSCTASAAGNYIVTVTGTSGSSTHSATVSVSVGTPDFSINAVPDAVTVFRLNPQASASTTFDIASINNYANTISFTVTITHPFADTGGSTTLPFNPMTPITLGAGGLVGAGFTATVVRATAGTGNYHVVVTATGGDGTTHSASLDIWVIDFSVSVQDTTITLINVPGTLAQDPSYIAPLGTPLNSDGFNINPGLTEGDPVYPTEYYPQSNTGRNFASGIGLDTSFTRNRCFLATFDSANSEIFPVFGTGSNAGRIVSFAGPVVHINGDQFGFPPNGNGCRLDGFWYVDPLNGNAIDNSFDTAWITVELLTTTPNGTYHVPVCYAAGGDVNCVSITIILVAPPAAPALTQNTGRTPTVSLAAGGQLNFKIGVASQSSTTTEYVQAFVTATTSDASITVTGTTGVFALPANGKSLNMPVTLDLSGVPAGTTLNLNVVILYGVAPHYLTQSSTATVGSPGKTIGTVVVTP